MVAVLEVATSVNPIWSKPRAVGRVEDRCQWDWGELAEEVGGEALKGYAEKVGKEYGTLRNHRLVVRAFPSAQRCADLSFDHHLRVLIVKDPAKRQGWLQWAAENNKSVAAMLAAIREQPPRPSHRGCASPGLPILYPGTRVKF